MVTRDELLLRKRLLELAVSYTADGYLCLILETNVGYARLVHPNGNEIIIKRNHRGNALDLFKNGELRGVLSGAMH